MVKILTDEDRKRIGRLAKKMGLGRPLSKEEHLKLIKGKQIMFSEEAIEDIEEMTQKIPEHYYVGWIGDILPPINAVGFQRLYELVDEPYVVPDSTTELASAESGSIGSISTGV